MKLQKHVLFSLVLLMSPSGTFASGLKKKRSIRRRSIPAKITKEPQIVTEVSDLPTFERDITESNRFFGEERDYILAHKCKKFNTVFPKTINKTIF